MQAIAANGPFLKHTALSIDLQRLIYSKLGIALSLGRLVNEALSKLAAHLARTKIIVMSLFLRVSTMA